jgi:predicted aminopeptidase
LYGKVRRTRWRYDKMKPREWGRTSPYKWHKTSFPNEPLEKNIMIERIAENVLVPF